MVKAIPCITGNLAVKFEKIVRIYIEGFRSAGPGVNILIFLVIGVIIRYFYQFIIKIIIGTFLDLVRTGGRFLLNVFAVMSRFGGSCIRIDRMTKS